ncbi:MAG: response regulator transcription factor [Anaerolineae bacterium]|nr:response regulator transcription factor [Anaerolineae bacterium]MBL6965868.1 response regulator transcription factor [Anaerolineales bacterium]
MPKILIVEDEPELVKVLRSYLEKSNFEVITAYRGDSGLTAWEQQNPDLVLLDLNLPGMDGLDVAREIRRKADTPIIMLTARVEEMDQLIGLELGADDYITKPYSPRLVVAKVRAVLRRSVAEPIPSQVLNVLDLEIDLDAHTVHQAGKLVDLTPTEFDLLVAMASQPGRAYARMQLLEASQGAAYEGYERTIDAHIKNLRAKLEVDPKNPKYIETVFGVGYRFARKTSGD